jgi:hypothetical protein
MACAPLVGCYTLYAWVVLASALGLSPLARLPALLIGGVALVAGGSFVLCGATSKAGDTEIGSRLVETGGAVLWFSGVMVVTLELVLALFLPVGAYDALGYRLPAMAQWLDAGRVAWVQSDDALRNGYALGLEVLMAAVTCMTGATALVDVLAPVFVVIGACALASLAEELGFARGAARITGGLFLLVPIHVLNAPSGYTDAAFAGAIAATLAFGASWAQATERRPGLVIALGTAAAFSCALKSHGFALAGLILGCAGFVHSRRQGYLSAARDLSMIGILCLPGLFFMLRNFAVMGNPVYPVEVRIAGRLLFAGNGSLDSVLSLSSNLPAELRDLPAWLRPLRTWLQLSGPATDFDDRLSGLGYAFPFLAVPAVIFGGVQALRDRRGHAARTLGLVLISAALCLCVQPMTFWSRYTSWLWAPGALASAAAILAFERAARKRLALLLAVSLCVLSPLEAAYALAHVKRIDRYGLAMLHANSMRALAEVSELDAGFIRTSLAGRTDVCRTPWRDGTDDANMDGIVAQLLPRPRMHIIEASRLTEVLAAARAHSCREVIVIGGSPLAEDARKAGLQVQDRAAFGVTRVIMLADRGALP